jgi:hypothetical protein
MAPLLPDAQTDTSWLMYQAHGSQPRCGVRSSKRVGALRLAIPASSLPRAAMKSMGSSSAPPFYQRIGGGWTSSKVKDMSESLRRLRSGVASLFKRTFTLFAARRQTHRAAANNSFKVDGFAAA